MGSKLFNEVREGDLITSALLNQIMGEIQRISDKLDNIQLPSGQDLEITGFSTPSGDLPRVKMTIALSGKNFLVPGSANSVSLAQVGSASFVGVGSDAFGFDCTSTRLSFTLPALPGVTEAGTPVNIVVSNSHGSDSIPITLRPEMIIPKGNVDLVYDQPPVLPSSTTTITKGTYIFAFSAISHSSEAGTFLVTPTVSSGWTASIVGATTYAVQKPSGSAGVAFPSLMVAVNVPDQPNGTVGTLKLLVTDTAAGSQVLPGNASIDIKIGDPPPTPEKRVLVAVAGLAGGAVKFVDGALLVKKDAWATVTFKLVMKEAGRYTARMSLRDPSSGDKPNPEVTTFSPGPSGSEFPFSFEVSFKPGSALVMQVSRHPDISVTHVLPLSITTGP